LMNDKRVGVTTGGHGARRGARPRPAIRSLSWALMLLWALAGAPALAAEPVTLNLKDADLDALITVVSEVTGRNFVVDPRVKAKVTVVSARPMPADELYRVFLSVLQVHGFAAVDAGAITKIVPDVNARQAGVPVAPQGNGDGDGDGAEDGLITDIVPLRYVAATPLVAVLRQIMPQQAALSAHRESNALIITDRAVNVARIRDIVRRIDVPGGDEIEVLPLRHASATALVKTVRELLRQGQAAAPQGQNTVPDSLTLAADERSNAILMSGEPTQRLRVRALVAQLDVSTPRNAANQVLFLNYADAESLVKVLKNLGRVQELMKEGGNGETATASVPVSQRVTLSMEADTATNAMILSGPPEAQREIADLVRELDVRRSQVLVEAVIAEVSSELARDLGANLVVDGRADNAGVPIGISSFRGLLAGLAASGGDAVAAVAGLGDGLNAAIGDFDGRGTDFGVLIRALSADSATNILSTPTLLTLDNEEASIVVGQNVPFVTGQYTGTGDTSLTSPFQTIEREDVGVKLKVKPRINAGGAVRLLVEQEVSSLSASAESASGFITNKRNITTAVLVESGEVVVLGGLIDDSTTDSQQRVPGLGQIPLLGELFKSTSSTKVKRNLLVFLRPRIVRDAETSRAYTDSQYQALREAQGAQGRNRLTLLPEIDPSLPEDFNRLLQHSPRL